jgi:hypothetical protein
MLIVDGAPKSLNGNEGCLCQGTHEHTRNVNATFRTPMGIFFFLVRAVGFLSFTK